MSTQEQRRAAFETWFWKEKWHQHRHEAETLFKKRAAGGYMNGVVHASWTAWNAALDSVVIELPGSFMPGEAQHRCIEVPDIIDAIEAAGLKVAP